MLQILCITGYFLQQIPATVQVKIYEAHVSMGNCLSNWDVEGALAVFYLWLNAGILCAGLCVAKRKGG